MLLVIAQCKMLPGSLLHIKFRISNTSCVLILLTLAPFVKFTLLGPQATTSGHGRWILVARLVDSQQLHPSWRAELLPHRYKVASYMRDDVRSYHLNLPIDN